ncbi:hypothetical protein PV326_004171 [Microctonus aethiopoides]|nr:hypothetical protein PV326_004171 [Microctonus aethiopoides]
MNGVTVSRSGKYNEIFVRALKLVPKVRTFDRADNNVYALIIETASEQFNWINTTTAVGEDIELWVLLTARTPTEKILYLVYFVEVFKRSSSTSQAVITNGIRFLFSGHGTPKKSYLLNRNYADKFGSPMAPSRCFLVPPYHHSHECRNMAYCCCLPILSAEVVTFKLFNSGVITQ